MDQIRVGIVGLGENARLRHVPGLRACEGVEITGVCNRRPESTQAAAEQLGISKTYSRWEELVDDAEIDAVLIGTWPYLHCPITLAALEAGKHVLTEARMARNADEARQMLRASQRRPELIAQIVPSPIGLGVDRVIKELLADGFLGELREAVILGTNDAAADPDAPIHWRQSASLSGINMLSLGILHETLIRWTADPVRVLAQTHTFTTHRPDPTTGQPAEVETPDAVRVLTEIPGGAIGLYHCSAVMRHGPGVQIQLVGSEGTLKYEFTPVERLLGATKHDEALRVIEIPADKAGGWRVEEEFIDAIRGIEVVQFTDFATGVRYMEFTEAVARSAASGAFTDVPEVTGDST